MVGPPEGASPDPALRSTRAIGLDAPASRYGNLVAQAQGCLFELDAQDGRVQRVAVPWGSLPFDLPRVQWQQQPHPGETGPAAMRAATMSLGSAGSTRSVRVVCVVPRAMTAAAFRQLVRVRAFSGHAAAQQADRSRHIVAQLARVTPVSRVPTTVVSAAAARIRQQLLGATPAARHVQRRQVLLQRSAAAPLVHADAIALAPPRSRVHAYATRYATGYGVPTPQRAGPRRTARAVRLAEQLGSFVVRPTCEEDPGDPEDPGDDGEGLGAGVLGSGRPIEGIGGAKPECGGGDGDPGDPSDPGDRGDPGNPDDPGDPGNPGQDCGNDQGCSCEELGDCDEDWDYYDELDLDCGNGASIVGVVDESTGAFTAAANANPDDFEPLPDDLDDDADLGSRVGCTESSGRTQCLQPGEAVYDKNVQAIAAGLQARSVATNPDPFQQLEYGTWLFRRGDGSVYNGEVIEGSSQSVCMTMGTAGGKNSSRYNGVACVGNPPPGAIGYIHTHPNDGVPSGEDVGNVKSRHIVGEIVTPATLYYFNPNTMPGFVELVRPRSSSGVNGTGSPACE